MAPTNSYNADSISVLEGLEAVRKRPGMYIGSVSRKGLNHLVYEIVDNSVDEHLAGFCSEIHVTLNKDGSATVSDNGRGIPVGMHKKGISAERLVFTTLHAGGKFDDSAYFRMGQEAEHFSSGDSKLIISYREWNICLLVCYDLRFPVWSRNVNNEYDLLIYVASWPQARRLVWDTLLRARALENMCYVCGVNRTGTDGNNHLYNGGSIVYSAKGEILTSVPDGKEAIATVSLNLKSLQQFRDKFPVWKDADTFRI